MKKKTYTMLAIAALLVLVVACKQETRTEVGGTETSSTTAVSATVPAVDTAAATDAAADATAEAAKETGTVMETAGQELQEEAKTGT